MLEKRAIETPTPDALADLGVGYLIQGDIDRAITTIEDAASQMNAAGPWSDLSAAYLAKAERAPARRVEYLAHGLEAAEQSLKIARSSDALFNRALALDGLAPYTGTPAPWSEYAAAEEDREWREAALRESSNDRATANARDQWEARRLELAGKLRARDSEFVRETVRLYPEAAIEFLEQELLVDTLAAGSAVLLASAIHEETRDPMSRDEAVLLRTAGPPLARAHRAYAEGLAKFEADDLAGARRALTDALDGFTRLNAPYRTWAEMQLGRLDWQEGRFEQAQHALARAEAEARRRGFNTLLGRTLWQRGLVYNRQWRLGEGLAAFRESANLFEAAGQRENAASVYSNLADALRMLGEPSESWEFIARTLENLPRIRKPIRRYLLLYNATLFARRQDLQEAALLFQDAALREAAKAGTRVLTEATIQRALVHIRRGDQAKARADFESSAQQLAATPPGSFRSYIGAELAIVRAQLDRTSEPGIAGLRDAIAFFERTEPGRVPGLYLLMARLPQSREHAEAALMAGIDRLERRQGGLSDESLRISYFDEAWTLFQDMVSLQVSARNPQLAFEFAERSRARSLLAATQRAAVSRTRTLSDIQVHLPPDVALIYYSTLADRLLIWTITASATHLSERPISERELSRTIEQHRQSVRDRREHPANDRLYQLLIEPVAQSLPASTVVVLVPDGHLQQLPFATLRNPASGRYLIEDHALMVSPSASFFVDARAAASSRAATPITSALLVGNPTAGATPSLRGAEAEVETISTLYRRREVLVGAMATKARFLKTAPAFDVVHFGGHAFANAEFPLLSRLVFADNADGEQSLFAHEIARLRFPRTRVVVLAACSTAAGTVSRGEGVVSVARPFLGGGVPLVIASQWDVDDSATETLTLAFHRELAKSNDPVRALQSAQLSMLRSKDAAKSSPEHWGAFIAVGTSTQ